MKHGRIISLVTFGALGIASAAQAGQHATVPATVQTSASAPVAHPSPAQAPPAHVAAVHHTSTSTTPPPATSHPNIAKPHALGALGINDSPLGPHFVGPVSPGGFVNPVAGNNNRHGSSKGSSSIILFGGYSYPYDYAANDPQVAGQDQAQDPAPEQSEDEGSNGRRPQYIFVQQVPDPRVPSRRNYASEPEAEADVAQPPAIPLRDVGSFTLITRAGDMLDAVAFTRSDDRLVYITPDGARRTIAFIDVDAESTRRLNQERGTPIDLPEPDDTPAPKQKTKISGEITN